MSPNMVIYLSTQECTFWTPIRMLNKHFKLFTRIAYYLQIKLSNLVSSPPVPPQRPLQHVETTINLEKHHPSLPFPSTHTAYTL